MFHANNWEDELSTVRMLEVSMINVKTWMNVEHHKLNGSKTEFTYFGSRHQLTKCTMGVLYVKRDLIQKSRLIRYLGAWLDNQLMMKAHITNQCTTVMWNFMRIRNVRQYLFKDSCKKLILDLCKFHLDYCTSILFGLPDMTIIKMQRIQNMCAK